MPSLMITRSLMGQGDVLPLGNAGRALVALVALVVLGGCGYHFKGGLRAPQGVETIAVTVLENRTWETGVETIFANDLLYEFARSKVLRIADRSTADAVLKGTIVSLDVNTISHTANYEAYEQRITMTLDLALTRQDGKPIWSDPALVDQEEYKVSSDKLVTEEDRLRAIKMISERLAEKVHNRILQDF
jgi:outer membrane lipopolysaccharide assembly protein LptE/RlpB